MWKESPYTSPHPSSSHLPAHPNTLLATAPENVDSQDSVTNDMHIKATAIIIQGVVYFAHL